MNYSHLIERTDESFQSATGVSKEVFQALIKIIREYKSERSSKGGRKPILRLEDQLLVFLSYYRQSVSYEYLGCMYGMKRNAIFYIVQRIENILKDHVDLLPPDSTLLGAPMIVNEVIMDATKCAIERPKKKDTQKDAYSGKGRRHTYKVLVAIDAITKTIIHISFAMGSVHDFTMFKMIQEWIDGTIALILDKGFQGVGDYHYNYLMPKKSSKKNPLSDDEKLVNSLISSIRIPIEHVFAKLKRFKIISTRFRNNPNQFQTKFNLIVGLYNFSLRTQGKGL